MCVDGLGCLFNDEGLSVTWWPVQITLFPIFMLFVLNHFIFVEKWDDITFVWYWFGDKVIEARDYIVSYGVIFWACVFTIGILFGSVGTVFLSSAVSSAIIALELIEL